jgi:exodeoxyribonuclease V alpha subunit
VEAVSAQLLRDCSVLSDTDPAELRSVYEAAAERLDLQMIDYLTIRDLVALSGAGGTPLHLLLIAMFMSLYEGSVCLRLSAESLKKKFEPVAGDLTSSHIRSILDNPGAFSELIYEKDPSGPLLFDDPYESYKPLILVSDGNDRFLYFQKYYAAEQALKTTLADILSRKTRVPENTDALAAAVKAVLAEKPVLVNGAPAVLNEGQLLGVVLPALNNFVLVSGGPGTGKTFIVINLLRNMARLGVPPERMRITAPTGRAAQKLAEAVRRGIMSLAEPDTSDLALASIQGETLHRLLRYSPSRNDFMHNRHNRLPADLVIIDEASMIDIMLLGRLLEAVEEGAGIVMLGDRNQLPSVEAGAVLSDLVSGGRTATYSGAAATVIRETVPGIKAASLPAGPAAPLEDRVVILTDSYRSEKSITSIASRINEQDESVAGEIPVLDPRGGLPGNGVWRIEPGPAGEQYRRGLHAVLAAWAARYYESAAPSGVSYRDIVSEAAAALPAGADGSGPLHALFARIDEARILSPLRSGPAGTAGINRYLTARIGRTIDPAGAGGIFAGAPIIVTRNDYDRSLFNGDVGVIMKDQDGRYGGLFSRFDGFASYPVEALPPFEPSFAITVHKSQGSEYGAVLLVLPEGMTDLLLTKEILYTGLTRAKHLVIIYAGRDMLRRAIQNKLERESGIRF